ncbi:hypothetical protein EVAR_74111_1 [Eumeta japonica]|uniref:Uncharacterized protein n=1 Tax=Eumeta variegata TaxID=151549 RepID=A0A4C1SV72_EUMVA|nr:hypothetical protein EVAR_74111_1 [Eumeta japonica]
MLNENEPEVQEESEETEVEGVTALPEDNDSSAEESDNSHSSTTITKKLCAKVTWMQFMAKPLKLVVLVQTV